MFQRISVLLILLTAFALLATPAMAKDPVTKLVVRNNLKNGRQFEAVFQPGLYVLHQDTLGYPYAYFDLHVISNPAPACFVRGEHNHPDFLGHLDPMKLRPTDAWKYFEVQDTCYLRFEIRDYYQGVVNIRQVKKVKSIQLTDQWQEFTFGPGRWSGSGMHKYFLAEYKVSDPACYSGSYRQPGILKSIRSRFTVGSSFILDRTCVVKIRGIDDVQDDDGNYSTVPVAEEIAFTKSR